jgi:hypothetical protein
MVELDPAFDSRNADKVLRSIEEWMVQQAHAAKPTIQTAGIDNCGPEKATQPSPIVAAPEPSFELSSSASPERPIDQTQQANCSPARSNALFVSKWMVRSVVGGLVIAIVVGVVWQTYRDNQARKLIKAWGHSSVMVIVIFRRHTTRLRIISAIEHQIIRSSCANADGSVDASQ